MPEIMRRIGIIALNTYRESVRDKILYNIVLLAVGLTIFSIVLGEWSVFDRAHVIKSISLSLMSISGLLIAVFVGISLVQKEIQRRTVFTLLSKPMARSEFLVGKYLGLLLLLLTHLSLLTAVFFILLAITHSQPTWSLLQAVYLIFWEMSLTIAIAIFFSVFSSPVLSALFTLGFYASGRMVDELLAQVQFVQKVVASDLVQQNTDVMNWSAVWAYRLLPGFHRFDISHQVIHNLALPSHYLLWSTLYAIGYSSILLLVASWWFKRRDFL